MPRATGSITIRRRPKDGTAGVPGQIIRQVYWRPGAMYHNDDETVPAPRYLDVLLVFDSNGILSKRFMCRQTYTSGVNDPEPTATTSYWQLLNNMTALYTPLLVADNGDIRFLQSHQILIQKANGVIDAGVSGHGDGANGIRFWAGDTNPASAPFHVDALGGLFSTKATIKGHIDATSGTFSGYINVPFVRLENSDAVYENGGYRLVKNLHVSVDFGEHIILPTSMGYNGAMVRILNYSYPPYTRTTAGVSATRVSVQGGDLIGGTRDKTLDIIDQRDYAQVSVQGEVATFVAVPSYNSNGSFSKVKWILKSKI